MLTAEQKELRRGRCGGSDVAAILGLSPWRTAFDVWAEKTNKVQHDDVETPPQRRGRLLEPAVAQWYAEETGLAVEPPALSTAIGSEDWMVGSYDRLVIGPEGEVWGLELKTSKKDDGWQDSGVEAAGLAAATIMPVAYATQVLWYLEVSGLARWDVAVFFTFGDEFRRYTIHRDPAQGAQLVAKVREWWQRHVVEGEQPPIDGSDSASAWLLSQYPRQRSDIRQATIAEQDLAERLHDAEARIETAKAEAEAVGNQLRAAIGESEGLRGPFGKVTWKWQPGANRLDADRLRRELPETADEYTKQGAALRVLRKQWSK